MSDAFVLPRTAPSGAGRFASLHDQLVDAFRGELAVRLPRLLAAAARLRRHGVEVSAATVRQLVSEVHTIATSAVVVGLHEAARAARACEHRLLAYTDGEPVPAVVVEEALGYLDLLASALQGWDSRHDAGVA